MKLTDKQEAELRKQLTDRQSPAFSGSGWYFPDHMKLKDGTEVQRKIIIQYLLKWLGGHADP